jgi:signal transduction histidine kinase/DNA-binding response OmpR family regulator/ligand-binding sensor domain-containing protein
MYNAIKITFPAILLLILTGNCFLLNASNDYKPKIAVPITETWRWQNFPELNGRGCQCMVEMTNGVLYFGVNGGIMQYDGLNWKYFPIAADFADIAVVTMCVSSDGIIYAGTSKGIRTFKNGKWGTIPLVLDFGDPSDFPYNKFPIIEASDHSIWIGARQGILRIKNGIINLYREDSYYTNISDKNNKYTELLNKPTFDIYSLFEDNTGKIWIGLRDGRIFNCKLPFADMNSKLVLHSVDKENNYVKAKFPLIKMDASGKIYIISGEKDGGINVFNRQKWVQFSIKKKFNVDDLQNDIILLKDGSICIGGIGRVFFIKGDKWEMFERTALPFPSNRLRLFQTSNNNLWIIGLSNDVWRIDLSYNKWITYNDLNFLAEDKNGDKWFLSIEGTVVRYIAKTNSWIQYNKGDGLIDTPVSIFITKNGEIWAVGSNNNVAATAYFDGKKWIKQMHPQLSWGIDRRAVLEAQDGSLWFGTCSDFLTGKGQLGGLVRYKRILNSNTIKFEYEYYPSNEKFRLYGIYGIGQTSDQDIWVGQLGFYRLKHISNEWERISQPVGLGQNFVDCIQSSLDGGLWVGTRTNGLFHLDSKTHKWNQYTTKNGLSSNSVLDILGQPNGNVWIATDREISHFDHSNWTNDVFPGVFKYMRDGISLRSSEDASIWVNLSPSVWYRRTLYNDRFSSEGRGDFKTTRYHPDQLQPSTEITFSMNRVAQPGNVILSWNANNPWKTTPTTQIQYSYRFDSGQWSPYSGKESEIFLSLASGNHTFEVKSRNRDMNVDPTPAHVSFYVEPPLWMTPWFIILILSFLATIASFINHLYHRNKIIQELSETRARLYTNISHELRTPLTLIMGSLSKILKLPEIDKEMKQPLNLMRRNSQRLLRLVNQILDYRKIEAGQMKFEPSKGDIIDFIHEEFISFISEAETKKIDISFKTDTEHLNIWFDPDKIEKIMFNLLSNAIKFTQSGKTVEVEINIDKNPIEKNIQLGNNSSIKINNWLIVIVRDTGIGISENDLGKIFERFFQVHDHSASITGGTGIGLSVAKEMVKIHFGEIDVESTPGAGTTFYVKIPIIDQEMIDGISNVILVDKSDYVVNIQPVLQTNCGNNDSKDRSKILIIEDNSDMRQFISSELNKDYEVLEAIDGIDGFEKALSFDPDLIISDIMMPQMDGIELCKKVKLDERTSHISVILLTARSSHENMLEGLETGADDYLGKPFNSDELKLRIHNIIETRKKIRERYGNLLNIEPKSIAITSVEQKLIEKAIEIIEQHMDDADFNVETFSSLMGMNRVSLHHKIKLLTNLAPREFFTMIRLKRAGQLLKESGLTVTEIAYQVGFKDPSHFSKLFKKQFGMSPKEFIKVPGV